MRLRAIQVHNFRGLLDGKCELHDYGLLVGANNAGKSTLIDAIRAFYEKGGFKFDKSRDFPFQGATDSESWIELEFELSDEECESLSTDYRTPTKRLRVRKKFQTKDTLLESKTSAEGYIFAYLPNGDLSKDSFYGAKNVQSGKFGDLVFIPAVSKVDEHAKLSGPSALRDLLTNVLEDVVESSEAFSQFTSNFEHFAAKIKDDKTTDGRSLAGLEGELNMLLRSWGTSFHLRLNPLRTSDIIKSLLAHEFVDQEHGKAQSAEQYGSGFQRHFIYSLIDIASRYVGKKSTKKARDFSPVLTLILFEEPEAFLHPPQQDIMFRGLRHLTEKTDRQVICSTHSSHFVSKQADVIPAIVRLCRHKATINVFQVTQEQWAEIASANQEINDIADNWPKMKMRLDEDDSAFEMEAVKHCLWLNPDRCGMFFANHVLVVEGPTEYALVNRLMGDDRIRCPERGVYVLDALGKYNIHRFVNLLCALGISHSVIYDDDNNEAEHKEINALIQAACRGPLTQGCLAINDELEALLGVPKTAPHRKPQHIMFLYEAGKIDERHLNDFCLLVNKCLP